MGVPLRPRLSRGMAASLVEIADDAGIEIEKAQRIFHAWISVHSDEAKRVIGFWGLTIAKMKHPSRSTVRSSTPGAPGTPSSFRSFWRSRRGLSPSATPPGNRCDSAFLRNASNRPDPGSVCISFLTADNSRFQQDIVQNFCHCIHFFRSRKDAEVWIAKTPDIVADPRRAERSYAKANWERLQALRRKYDPDGLFHGHFGVS